MKHYYPSVSDLSTRDLTKLIIKAVTELKHRDSPERSAADERVPHNGEWFYPASVNERPGLYIARDGYRWEYRPANPDDYEPWNRTNEEARHAVPVGKDGIVIEVQWKIARDRGARR